MRRLLGTVFCVSLLALTGFAADRDPDRRSVKGIPKGHKHAWAVVGGTALGAGLGAIPGGGKNVLKGALIGGSGASAFYLAGHRHQEGPWSYVITNAVLIGGIGWTLCDCGAGFPAGALVGGGGTALIQAFHTRHRTLAKVTGAETTRPSNPPPYQEPAPPPQPQSQPPQGNSPPQNQQPQGSVPPPEPESQPPQDNSAPQNQQPQSSVTPPAPQSQPPQDSSPQPQQTQPPQNQQAPPPQNLPDAPRPQAP